jgi:photosystem II stability/assembly factor-like uncharacterized protein
MAKTAAKPKKGPPSKQKGTSPRGRKRPAPKPWYQRVGLRTWGVIAAIVAIAFFALLNRGEQRPTEAVSLPVVGADLHSLVVDPQDPSRLFIGSHSGVSVSTDAGKTWRVVQSLNGADAMGWAFTDDAIFMGGHPGISVSTDTGKTFESRNEGLPSTDVHALGAGGETIYAGLAGIGTFASTDGGQSWEARSEEVGGAFMGRILVDPADDQHLVAPDMEGGAVESSDGGRSWQVLGGVRGALWVTWDESDTDHIIVATQGSAAETTDGGQTWDAFDVPDGASIVEFSPDDPETLYAAVLEDPNARVFISRDGGGQWEQL